MLCADHKSTSVELRVKTMRISIVTISYNQIAFLRKCIDSVLSQQDVELEYIIVDPGSTDGSRELISSYGSRVIKIFQKDEGPADGLNNGFSFATGDIYGFVNSDDYLLPGALRTVCDYFEKHGLNSFLSGSGYILNKSGILKPILPTRMELKPMIYGACTVFQQGTFFPEKFFTYVGGFNSENRTCWDGELFIDFISAGYSHHIINQKLAVFRLYDESITGSGRLQALYKADRRRIFKKITGRDYAYRDRLVRYFWRLRKITYRTLFKLFPRILH